MPWHTHFTPVQLTSFLHQHFDSTIRAIGLSGFHVEIERKESRAAVKVNLVDDEGEVARFVLESHPKCAGIADSIDTEVQDRWRGKKIAQLMVLIKCKLALHLGFSMMLATVKVSNVIENHILLKNSWKKGSTFLNKRTNNDVTLWTNILEG